jgi:hypothetical protein
MLGHDKLGSRQSSLEPLAALHLAPQNRLHPRWLRALEHGAKLRNTVLGSLPDAHRTGAVPNALSFAAIPTNNLSIEQPQRLRSVSACWADKKGPGAAVWKPSKGYINDLFDVAELQQESRGLGGDHVQRSQARNGNGRQVVTVSGYHTKLDGSINAVLS